MKFFEKSAIFFAMWAAAAGCATSGNYQKRVASWQGQKAEQLLQAWGMPNATERLPDGDQILVYSRLYHEPYSFGEAPRELASVAARKPMYIKCATYFDIRDGRVFSAMFQGEECSWRD